MMAVTQIEKVEDVGGKGWVVGVRSRGGVRRSG